VIEVVPRETLERLAALAPEEEPRAGTPPRSSRSGPDLDEWLKEYGASLPPYRAKNKARVPIVLRLRRVPVGSFAPGSVRIHGAIQPWPPRLPGVTITGAAGNGWTELRALVEPKRPKPTPVRKEPRPLQNSAKPAIDTREEVPATWPGGEDSPSICTTGGLYP